MLQFVRVGSGLAALAALVLVGCGGGGGGDDGGSNPQPVTYSVGGTTSGLSGNIVLRLNTGANLTVSGANFTFGNRLTNTTAYTVTIQTQPTGQTCTLGNATGTIAAANVTNVSVTCTNNLYSLGGNVAGLTGSLVLRLNGANDLTINGNGAYTFGTQLAHGTAFTATIQTQPAEQICSVNNGAGNVAGANVTNIDVTCANESYVVGGNVIGLSGTVVLRLNGSNDLTVTAAGAFQFPTALAGGSNYDVTVFTQPLGQSCAVTNGSGTGIADVSNVAVACTNNPNTYTVGGTLSGLTSGEITLRLNNGNDLVLNANGAFTFNARLPSGTIYGVNVHSQPPGQACIALAAGGVIGTANLTNVMVSCNAVANTFQLGGNVNGLVGEIWLVLNGGNLQVISANGAYAFDARLPSGTAYTVSIARQPDSQACVITNNIGTMPAGNLANVNIGCNDLSIGGTVTNLNGAGLALELNGLTELTVPVGATTFTFPAGSSIRNGALYTVHIKQQPAGQTCTILHSSGFAPTRPVVTNIDVDCLDNITDSLAGTYLVTSVDGDPVDFGAAISFHADGTYIFALRSDDVDCGAGNGNGIEYGVYRWNSTTRAFALRNAQIDTNGGCGVADNGAMLGGTLTRNANGTLSADLLDNTGSGDHILVSFSPAASTANSIIGSWGDNQSFVIFRSDNTFFHATSKHVDNAATTFPGIEHACYSLVGSPSAGTFQANFGGGCNAGGLAALDTTGNAGFSPILWPVQFIVEGDTMTAVSGPITPFYGETPRIKTN